MKNILFVILSIFLLQSPVFASQEGVLQLSSFTIESKGIGSSGPVKISGDQNQQNEIVSLKIEAFGEEYKISNENLKKLPKILYNGIQISYEEGYKSLGGKTIYIVFQKGFTSGIKEQTVLSLTENNTVKIEEIKLDEKNKTTKLTKDEVLIIAQTQAKQEGFDITKYNLKGCDYEFTKKDKTWTVSFEQKPPTPPGGHFLIWVDDQTKKATLILGE
ncbi:hypothetical protein HY745_11185 [Candidatus Desantisbacteria bacterium]|nr:hypothetical protein [Candidatus Desantisbacteria bacterium]